MNNLEMSKIHYTLSNSLIDISDEPEIEKVKMHLNNYNGLASIYRSIKQWPECLHYLLKATEYSDTDPDINNQLGVVYTEMRRTDLADVCYKKAIANYTQTFISSNPENLLAELYLNHGHMHSYNGDNASSIDCYNNALKINPKFILPYQNKIMNLNYLFDQLDDPMYITKQHRIINKIYKKNDKPFIFNSNFYNTPKINIGISSGDFENHPVSFFISTLLKNYDISKFNITCYSETIINTNLYNKNINFKLIKGMSAEKAAQLIYNDRTHILLDLAGHTAFNRLDIFALKPSPIQISYIGYPFTTGLNEMDYRITDAICDKQEISQKFYTEKLLYLPNCFTCYDPNLKESIPLTESPINRNRYLTIGCFNRLNKITDNVIFLFNKILLDISNVRFVFKTKALINTSVASSFLEKFDISVRNRIKILDCTLTHEEHLETYNQIDVAIDTFPYSGTTTTCESLYMGKGVFSLYDTQTYFHAQNVTCSILKNSGLDFYVCNNTDELLEKIKILKNKSKSYWKDSPKIIREQFLNGSVCDQKLYMTNIQDMFIELYSKYNI
jgi:protein O-GlcNAc transferase